ncbi:hypothetical protein EMIT0P294_140073 [Pseudomonas sp. IT-P294]
MCKSGYWSGLISITKNKSAPFFVKKKKKKNEEKLKKGNVDKMVRIYSHNRNKPPSFLYLLA